MKTYTILLGGDVVPGPRLTDAVHGTQVIAADSGIRHAEGLGVTPDLWVGDFDSSDAGLVKQHAQVKTLEFDSDKDMTDGEIAIHRALEFGAERLVLVGAFGGARMEHEFCHLAQALRLAHSRTIIELIDGNKEVHPIPLDQTVQLSPPPGTSFSILAFSDLEDLTILGAKWPLDKAFVPFGSSLTLSNETIGPLSVSLGRGRALLLLNF